MIGIYSPVGRCLKTSFAFVLGQLLSKKHKVLYLNLESYSGLGKLLEKNFTTDLGELIYYLQNSKESFGCRMGGMIEQAAGLDILPPFDSYLDLISVSGQEWIHLLQEIERNSTYEYLILDLSDNIPTSIPVTDTILTFTYESKGNHIGYQTECDVYNYWNLPVETTSTANVMTLKMFSNTKVVAEDLEYFHITYANSSTVDEKDYQLNDKARIKDYVSSTNDTLIFEGWSLEENSNEIIYLPYDTVLITEDIILYPVFKEAQAEEEPDESTTEEISTENEFSAEEDTSEEYTEEESFDNTIEGTSEESSTFEEEEESVVIEEESNETEPSIANIGDEAEVISSETQ